MFFLTYAIAYRTSKWNIIDMVSVPVVTPTECAAKIGTQEDGWICSGGETGKGICSVSKRRGKIVII